MRNGKSLREAVMTGYAQRQTIGSLVGKEQLLNYYNHLINGHVQVMEFKEVENKDDGSYQLRPGDIVELKTMADRESYFKTITRKGLDTLSCKGRRIMEACTYLGKNTVSSDGVNYVKPYEADALDDNDKVSFFAAAGCVIMDILQVVSKITGMPKGKLEPRPVALVYHWGTKDDSGKPECAHFHLVISCNF